jgi:chaperonin GroES
MIRPHNDYVLIDRPKSDDVTEGGVFLPNISGRKKKTEGVVVAVGPGMKDPHTGIRTPMQVKVGDRVTFRQYDVIKDRNITDENGKPFIFIREPDLWAILEPEEGERYTAGWTA